MQRTRVTYLAASWLLGYPDEGLLARLPVLERALAEHPGTADGFAPVMDRLRSLPLHRLQSDYVQEFDLSRRHALHLSYWTDGDTRRRGEVLAAFKRVYRAGGMPGDTHGELPDYLPMVLEFAARVDLVAGRKLLSDYRPSLEMLRLALEDDKLPHSRIVGAICSTLPGKPPADRQEIMRMAGLGPPTEQVGLDPYDPRLLPIQGEPR